jgi:Domain of unknown function (DUF4340)
MTGRGLAVQGGIAVLGLVTVYATWQREPERAPGAVTVIDASKSDVTKVHFEDEALAVDLTRGPGGDQSGIWLHLVTKKADAKTDPHSPPKPEPKPDAKPAPLPPARDLPGADNAKHLFEQFGPLVSLRAFGVLDAAKLKELGLDNPKRKLEVTVKGDVRRYDIGAPAAQSSGESFIRDVRDGRVYLMPRNVLTELQNAQHLVDRRLHTFDLPDFDRIKLAAGGKSKEFVQVGRESRSTMGFAPAKTPDKKDQMAKNWHDALWRVFATEQLGKGEEPTTGKVSVVLRVDYSDGKNNVGWTEIGRVEAGSGLSDEAAPAGEVYARTEHTAGWSKIPSGGQLIPDAQKLIAAP